MGRLPKARAAVLAAARRIVVERGAGALTFEELAAESGVTRGGINYHFATKEALLQGLIEEDMRQWHEATRQLAPSDVDEKTGDLVAFIRLATRPGDDHRRFVGGMLAAVMLEPSLLSPCREYFRSMYPAGDDWEEDDVRRTLLRLAADGLFWTEVLGLYEFPQATRERLIDLMESLATGWCKDADRP